jgi:hypothetical protein
VSFRIEHDIAEMEKLLDLLFTNTDEPLIKLAPEALEAKNMSPDRTNLYELRAHRVWFTGYEVERDVYGYLRDRKKVKSVLRALKAAGAYKATIIRKNDKILLNDSEIGEVDETITKFEIPELKLELIAKAALDGRSFKRWLSSSRKAGADALGYACKEPKAIPPVRATKTVALNAFDEEVWLSIEPIDVNIRDPRFGAAYSLSLVEQFLPPSVFLRKGWPSVDLLGARGYRMPMSLEFTYASPEVLSFKAYVAPNFEYSSRFLRKLDLLKPLTKEDVLAEVKRYWLHKEVAAEKWEIERELEKDGFEIEGLEAFLSQLVKKEKLIMRERGWKKFYSPAEMPPPKLKPLTEDVVLKAIRDFCEAADTDAVGFAELEGYLAKEYLVDPLHDILKSLREKGLVESKPWPVKRPGGYAVDMRGYWAIKPTPPEEAVEQAVEAEKRAEEARPKLKPGAVVRNKVDGLLWEVVRANTLINIKQVGRVPRPSYADALPHTLQYIEKLDPEEVLRSIKIVNGIEPEVPVVIAVVVDTEKWVWAETDLKRYVAEKNRIPDIHAVESVPPAKIPPGYVKVRFLRDMVRFMGMDRRSYGPFTKDEEAVIPSEHADIFERHRYVEIVARAGGEFMKGSSPLPRTPHAPIHNNSPAERQTITTEYKILEYGGFE